MSILAVLVASACACLMWRLLANVESFMNEFDSDSNGVGAFCTIALFLGGLASVWGASMHGWTGQITWTVIFTLLACVGVWMYENPDRTKSITETLYGHFFQAVHRCASFAKDIWQRITHNDTFVRRYARKRVSQLCSLMPGVEWSDMRDQIASVGISALNSLLARRKLLQTNISATARIIKKYEGNLSSDVMHQLHARTLVDMETFQQELAKTETQIRDIVGFLDEVESDVRMALISDDGHAELDKRLLQFATSIHSVKAEERVVEQELRSYLGHSSMAVPEDSDSASQAHSHIQRALE